MRNVMFWVAKRIRRHIPALAAMTLAHMGQALLGVGFALGTRLVIDSAVSGEQDAFWEACLIQGGIIAGLLLCQILYRHLHELLLARLDRQWKQSLLRDLLHSEYSEVSQFHSGELLNRMNNDVRILNRGLLDALPNVAALLTRLVAAVVVLTALEPWFSLVICGAGGVVILTTGLLRQHLKKLHKAVSEQEGRVLGFLQETLEKLVMVQAMDAGEEMERRSELLLADRYAAQRKRKNMSLFSNACVNFLSHAASFGALLWCCAKLLRGQLSFGTLTSVTQLVSQIQTPAVSLSAVIPQYIAMTAAAERLQELSDLKPEEKPLEQTREELYEGMTAIRAEDLCFSYDRDTLLERVFLELPKGAFAVITGASGIGKSTLLKLLMGFCKPGSGQLYLEINGNKLEAGRAVRRLFAYVPQGNLLLSGTLRDNLIIAKPDATGEEIGRALYVSTMDEYLPQLPAGLETMLGENSAGLSEGQAQRLAIARAILGGAPILLLDECTSALDVETEQKVLRRIRELPDRTCIAVTHRPAAIELCDLHLEVTEGQILVRKMKT